MSQHLFGRVLLWQTTIDEVVDLLRMASRSEDRLLNGRGREVPKDEELAKTWATLSYAEHQPVAMAYENAYPDGLEFPTLRELDQVTCALRMLAVVAFLRIWNKGYGDDVRAAKNTEPEVEVLREKMLQAAFQTPEERDQFDKHFEILRTARDGSFAHADAAHRNLNYQQAFVAHDMPAMALNPIEFGLWRSHLDRLKVAARQLIEELGS